MLDHILHRRMWREIRLGDKPAQIMMMARLHHAAIAKKNGLRVSELAASFGITASGVTQMVTALEEHGYVARIMDPDDRRAVRVLLTENGESVIKSAMVSINTVFQGLIDHLGEERSREFLSLLTDVSEYFDDFNGAPAGSECCGQAAGGEPGIETAR